MKTVDKKALRARRHRRARRKMAGTPERPRMAIALSNCSMTVQFIDDIQGHTVAAASTMRSGDKANVEAAASLGRRAAELAQAKGINHIVVDRGGRKYHGRVRVIVESALEAGLTTSAKEDK